MKIYTKQIIDVSEWDKVVVETYGRPYSLQQQEGCRSRGSVPITVPCEDAEDFENDTIDHKNVMGVSFKSWLEKDPKQAINNRKDDFFIQLFWDRNFYPDLGTLANDLHAKGILPAGEYLINIDW